MTTLNDPRQPGPRSAGRHDPQRQDLAVLTRANHDMRSPLSVILGVFDLLEDTGSLTDNEHRYLKLGMRAADELLMLADALRLYSALERNLVTLDPIPVDLAEMVKEQLESVFSHKGTNLDLSVTPPGDTRALGDAGYLPVALTHLLRHLAAHLPETPASRSPAITLCRRDEGGHVRVQVARGEPGPKPDTGNLDGGEPPVMDELGVLIGIRLIEMMGGSVIIGSQPSLTITLPAAGASPPA